MYLSYKSSKIVLSSLIFLSSFVISTTFWLTPKEEKWVITIESPALAYESPERFTPFALEEAPEDIDYRVSILPYDEDRNDDMYIVLPTLGLITPIVFVPEGTQDHADMSQWREIDINKYLVEWVMHYANSWMPGEVWNPVIFGHSNYFVDKPGKDSYKSIFADIMDIDVWPLSEMRVYTKQDNWEYELKKFNILESYETHPTDVEILRPKWGKELTVFACTNGLKWRWILRGRLIEPNELLVPYEMKYTMYDIVQWIQSKSDARAQRVVIEWVKAIEKARKWLPASDKEFEDKLTEYVLNYIERELVKVYPS